jgi:hypothetical protein
MGNRGGGELFSYVYKLYLDPQDIFDCVATSVLKLLHYAVLIRTEQERYSGSQTLGILQQQKMSCRKMFVYLVLEMKRVHGPEWFHAASCTLYNKIKNVYK